jgi:hypothetical protein
LGKYSTDINSRAAIQGSMLIFKIKVRVQKGYKLEARRSSQRRDSQFIIWALFEQPLKDLVSNN